jgi:hypothetical protein
VRFLPSQNANQELLDNGFENLVSNLGKVSVVHSAKPQTVVVATKINADSSGLAETSVTDCLQIPKDYNLNVCVAEGLLKKNPAYVNVVSKLNQAFLDKYDLKELDNLHKCQYLDQPSGNTKRIVGSVLAAKVHEPNNVPELLPRNSGYVKLPPAPPPKPTPRRGREITPATCDQQSRKTETVRQYETCKDINEKAQNVGQYDDVKVRCPREQYDDVKPRWTTKKYAYKKDHHIYESISDDNSSNDDYEDIDDFDVTKMTSHDYVDMTSHDFVAMTSQAHVSMTSEEDQYYTMSDSVPQNNRNENTSTSPRLEYKSENLTKTTKLESARKLLLKLPFFANPSDNKTSTETTGLETKLSPRLERKGENLTETTRLEPARKSLVKLPFPADPSTPRPDNKTSTETTRLETKLSPGLERKSENLTETTKLEPARKILLKFPFPVDADNKTATEITRSEPNCTEASDKSIKLEVDNKTSQKVSSPTELSAQNLKPGSDNSAENITLEPVSKKLVPKTKTRSTVPTRKPAFPIPKDQCDLPIRKALCAIPIPTELSSLTVEGVGRLLTSLNMACYADNFQEEQIDGEILMELDETALKSLDLKPFHVRKLIKVIAGWRPNVDGNKD